MPTHKNSAFLIQSFFYSRLTQWLAASIGIVSSLVLFWVVRNGESERNRINFERAAEGRIAAIYEGIAHSLEEVTALGGLFSASRKVERWEFHAFIKHLHSGNAHDPEYIEAFEWAPRITANERNAFEETARREGPDNFLIIERKPGGEMGPAANREEYFPVFYYPSNGDGKSLAGFDLASDPVLLESLNLARDSGEIAVTARIRPVQEKGGQYRFLVLRPVYRPNAPVETVEERRRNLLGFVAGTFRIVDLIDKSIKNQGPREAVFFLYDLSVSSSQRFLAHYPMETAKPLANKEPVLEAELKKGLYYARILDVANRQWRIVAAPTPDFLDAQVSTAWMVLVAGLLTTGLLTVYLRSVIERSEHIRVQAAELSRAKESLEKEVEDRSQVENALRKSEERLQLQFDRMPVACIVWNGEFCVESWNPAAERIFGFSCNDALGRHAFDLIVPPEVHPHARTICQRLLQGEPAVYSVNENMTGTGRKIICEWINTPLKQSDGSVLGFLSMAQDITERKKAEERLHLSGRIFKHSSEMIIVTDPQLKIVDVNEAFSRMSGYSPEEAKGHGLGLLRSDRYTPAYYRKLHDLVREAGQWQGEIVIGCKGGGTLPLLATINCIENETGEPTHLVGMATDISRLKDVEEKYRHMAYFDPLTDLPNRTLLQDRLKQALYDARRNKTRTALLFLDIDNFKDINDSFGHQAGDRVLVQTAGRLGKSVRRSDTLARMGGDEFVIVMRGLSHPEDSMELGQKIRQTFSHPFLLDGVEIYVSVSIGLALYPDDGSDSDELIQKADIALYHAKSQGKNRCQYFCKEMDQKVKDRLTLQTQLRHALKRNEFLPYFQPQVNLRSGNIDGVEVLLRWQHPEQGFVQPGAFIPLAEETGLIVPIGEKVLETTCRQIRAWQEKGLPPLRVAINLSAVQLLQEDLAIKVEHILKDTGIDPGLLELEITESAVMQDPEMAADMLRALRAIGIRHITMDDFGTGYSSLNYLKRFPIDKLKIDRSFIQDLPFKKETGVLVRTIITMARNLDLKVVAEGVENEAQVEFLTRHGCDVAQGFYFFKPMPVEELTQFLAEGHRKPKTGARPPGSPA